MILFVARVCIYSRCYRLEIHLVMELFICIVEGEKSRGSNKRFDSINSIRKG